MVAGLPELLNFKIMRDRVKAGRTFYLSNP